MMKIFYLYLIILLTQDEIDQLTLTDSPTKELRLCTDSTHDINHPVPRLSSGSISFEMMELKKGP